MSNSDEIILTLSKIADRLAENPPPDETKILTAQRTKLAFELSEIVEDESAEHAARIAASAKRLREIIASANTLPFSQYWKQLTDLAGGGGGGSTGGAGTSDGAGRVDPPPPPPPPPPVASPGSWQQLLTTYRSTPNISDALKIASVSQWIKESGRGTSNLAKLYLNFGGIKYRERMTGYATPVDYQASDGISTYCQFSSVDAFIAGYWHFIRSGPYQGWEQFTNDAEGFVRHIASRYSADPDYADGTVSLLPEARQLLGAPPTVTDSRQAVTTRTTSGSGDPRVAIVVGHNNRAPGAGSGSPISRSEFPFNSDVAKAMKAEAAQYNVTIEVFFRQPRPDVTTEIKEVYAAVAAWSPSCVMELHFNSADDPAARGAEVLFAPDKPDAVSLAKTVAKALQSSLGVPLRQNGTGLKPLSRGDRGWISVTALPDVTSVLCEPFFGSNAQDCAAIGGVGPNGLAIAYLRALREFIMLREMNS